MPRSPAIVVALLAAGCAAPAAGPRGDRAPRAASVRVERNELNPILRLPRRYRPAPPPAPPRSPVAQPEPVPEASPEVLIAEPMPDGVRCTVVGTGSPFPQSCEPPSLPAFTARTGGASKVRFGFQNVEVTWGFFEGGRAFVALTSGGVRLRAYADVSSVRFQLTREVEVVPGHVWLGADAPVVVRRATAGGDLQVRVVDDMPGVADVPSTVSCQDLRFELALTTSSTAATSAPPALRDATVKGNVLHLLTAPGGKPITALRGDADHPLTLVSVLAENRDHARVALSTAHARFDAWAPRTELAADGDAIGGVGGFGACGRSTDYIGSRIPRVRGDTPIRVGVGPDGEPIEGLVAVDGTEVRVGERRGNFVAVSFWSEIDPAPGLQFWVPLAALD